MSGPPNLPQIAGILCNAAQFQRFAGERVIGPDTQSSAIATAEHVRKHCGIPNRRDLATNTNAAAKFRTLQTEFDAWRGRIGRPQ